MSDSLSDGISQRRMKARQAKINVGDFIYYDVNEKEMIINYGVIEAMGLTKACALGIIKKAFSEMFESRETIKRALDKLRQRASDDKQIEDLLK